MRRTQLLLISLSLTFTILCFAQGSGRKGPPSGGEESTTNLSYPAHFHGTSQQTGGIGTYSLGVKALGTGLTYGCLVPETIGTTTYPNTSCVVTTDPGDFVSALSYEECVIKCGSTEVERIYWQKNASNKWQAGYTASGTAPLQVDYIDWGDNLEGKTWPAQTLRVETNTFSLLPEAGTALANNPRVRFDLWHVSGAGTNEMWGLHATTVLKDGTGSDGQPIKYDDLTIAGEPYLYLDTADVPNWSYGVNVATGARLNIARLGAGDGTCPDTGTGLTQSPYEGTGALTWAFNETSKTGNWEGADWSKDMLYGAELNIKGSYVYGYNWNLRTEPIPDKTGWWRLTFYTPDNSIDFTYFVVPTDTANLITLAPPSDELVKPGLLSSTSLTPYSLSTESLRLRTQDRDRDRMRLNSSIAPTAEEGGDTGLQLYVPQVDKTNQLTYLDICVKSGKAGGGGGKKPN